MTIHTNDVEAWRVAKAAFPEYKGRTLRIQVQSGPMDVCSYWDGGSRSYFRFIRLDDLTMKEVPAQSAFDRPIRGADAVTLPDGVACVEHAIFCGKDMGLRIHVGAANVAPFLPPTVELDWMEKAVLKAARSLKSSYAGISNYRKHACTQGSYYIGDKAMSSAEYDAALNRLKARGLIRANGAITMDGRNAIA